MGCCRAIKANAVYSERGVNTCTFKFVDKKRLNGAFLLFAHNWCVRTRKLCVLMSNMP